MKPQIVIEPGGHGATHDYRTGFTVRALHPYRTRPGAIGPWLDAQRSGRLPGAWEPSDGQI